MNFLINISIISWYELSPDGLWPYIFIPLLPIYSNTIYFYTSWLLTGQLASLCVLLVVCGHGHGGHVLDLVVELLPPLFHEGTPHRPVETLHEVHLQLRRVPGQVSGHYGVQHLAQLHHHVQVAQGDDGSDGLPWRKKGRLLIRPNTQTHEWMINFWVLRFYTALHIYGVNVGNANFILFVTSSWWREDLRNSYFFYNKVRIEQYFYWK